MITVFGIECFKGALRKTQTIVYNNGLTIKRIFAKDCVTPEDVITLKPGRPVQAESPSIMHREEELYRYHYGL